MEAGATVSRVDRAVATTSAAAAAATAVAAATPATVADGSDMPPHSWSHVPAEKFNVRHGPNYATTKRKGKSASSLYELRGVDWYKAGRKVDGVGESLNLPDTEFCHPSVPSLLVVNVQLPMEPPKVFKGAKLDGPTLHAVFYFSLKEETALALASLDTADPSVRLLANYFRRAGSEPEVRSRFKALGVVNNAEKINMKKLISPFNGKPVLITESGTLVRGIRRPRKEIVGGGGGGGGGGCSGISGISNGGGKVGAVAPPAPPPPPVDEAKGGAAVAVAAAVAANGGGAGNGYGGTVSGNGGLVNGNGGTISGGSSESSVNSQGGITDDKGTSSGGNSSSGGGYGAEEYVELDIHVRRWNFMARKGLNKLTPKFGSLNVSVAFVIEGRHNAELPEGVLGCGTLNALDAAKALEIPA